MTNPSLKWHGLDMTDRRTWLLLDNRSVQYQVIAQHAAKRGRRFAVVVIGGWM